MTQGQQPENPVEYWWTLRALLVAMDHWVRDGQLPPASQHPKLADGTLVAASQVAFPAIPNVASPKTVPALRQGDREIPFLVPQVDADGNELAGVRTPEITVPVATYTGWNFRNPSIGGTRQLVSLMGSAVPFAPTKEREGSGRSASIASRSAIRRRRSTWRRSRPRPISWSRESTCCRRMWPAGEAGRGPVDQRPGQEDEPPLTAVGASRKSLALLISFMKVASPISVCYIVW